MSTFVVIGARGGVGQQLVHRLLARDASLVAKVIASPNAIPDPNANPVPSSPSLTLTSTNQVIAAVRDPSALTTAGTGLRQAPFLTLTLSLSLTITLTLTTSPPPPTHRRVSTHPAGKAKAYTHRTTATHPSH